MNKIFKWHPLIFQYYNKVTSVKREYAPGQDRNDSSLQEQQKHIGININIKDDQFELCAAYLLQRANLTN